MSVLSNSSLHELISLLLGFTLFSLNPLTAQFQPAGLNFACDNSNRFFQIEGRKYFDGETAYVCQGDEPIIVTAFRDDGVSFPPTTEWEGVSSADFHQAEIEHSSVSSDAMGTAVSASFIENETAITLMVNVVTVGVDYTAYTDQTYGYDENDPLPYSTVSMTDPHNSPFKSLPTNGSDIVQLQLQPAGINPDLHFDFLQGLNSNYSIVQNGNPTLVTVNGGSLGEDQMVVRVGSPNGCYDDQTKLYLENYLPKTKSLRFIIVHEENDDVAAILPSNGKANTVAITAGNNQVLNTIICSNCDDQVVGNTIITGANGVCETTATGDDVQVIPLQQGQPNQVAIRYGINNFRDTPSSFGDDITDSNYIHTGANGICETEANNQHVRSDYSASLNINGIEDYLTDEVYSKAVLSWNYDVAVEFINFDLNRDGKLNVVTNVDENDHPITDERAYNDELVQLIDNCNSCDVDRDHYLFLFDHTSRGDLGLNAFNYPYGFIFPQNSNSTRVFSTIAHELGHGAFGLRHVWETEYVEEGETIYPSNDEDNVMNSPSGTILRKFQWGIIQQQ